MRLLGALLFFLSLAYFLISYLTTFGVSAPASPALAAVAWNVGAFTLFALHHSVFARTGVRDWVARTAPPELERSIYVVVASILFAAVIALWRPVPGIAWQAEGVSLWTLRLVQVAGIVVTLRSAAALDIRDLAGLRPATEIEFKTRGPYGWVRHPIYTGWFLFVWGASPMTITRLVFAATSCAYLLIAIPFEERSLRSIPGGSYERYSANVRWRLIPGVF